MLRSADYTIQGFLYQFNKTALEILKATDDYTITIEGVVEDIEVASVTDIELIQCKYHEAKTDFVPSVIYKPLIQMLNHFSEHPIANIRYVLFAYFPNISVPPPVVNKNTFQEALKSKNKEFKKNIDKLSTKDIDLDVFESRFTMEFGQSYDEIVKEVNQQLEENGIPSEEIETLAYPNTIHKIATLSIKHDSSDRQITKKQFLDDLKKIRSTAISRWTLALKTRKKLLEARRKQLKSNLDKNVRLRYFVIDPDNIEDYENEIVLFIIEYIDKYHFKLAHTDTPILCLCENKDNLQKIQRRLYKKNIITVDGYIGGEFQEAYFFREPIFCKADKSGKVKREFSLRILNWEDHGELINKKKCDDLFVIGERNCESLDVVDVNVERLAGLTMKELKYVIGVSNVYE